jgi:hypothetical protein
MPREPGREVDVQVALVVGYKWARIQWNDGPEIVMLSPSQQPEWPEAEYNVTEDEIAGGSSRYVPYYQKHDADALAALREVLRQRPTLRAVIHLGDTLRAVQIFSTEHSDRLCEADCDTLAGAICKAILMLSEATHA